MINRMEKIYCEGGVNLFVNRTFIDKINGSNMVGISEVCIRE